MTDVGWLFVSRIFRLFACGLLSVVLGLYLAALGLGDAQIGLLLGLTLLGDAVISLWLSTQADRRGRRLVLLGGAGLMILGGLGITVTHSFPILLIAATIGVISPTGAEVGPFLAVEQACLAQVVADRDRTRMFAWYHLAGFSASALGALAGGWLAGWLQGRGWSAVSSYRAMFVIFAAIGGALGGFSRLLSSAVELDGRREAGSPRSRGSSAGPSLGSPTIFGLGSSRSLVLRLSALFALDSFAGGFIIQAFVALWFHRHFGASEEMLGVIFFATNLLSGFSALAAVPMARRFGLVNTMVWTHLPSNVLLILVPLMPGFGSALAMLLARHLISQMDVPTRQSYVNAVVPATERSAANGVTGTARQLGASLAPVLAGRLLGPTAASGVPFFVCGGLKIVYDLTLWRLFRTVRPPEESSRS